MSIKKFASIKNYYLLEFQYLFNFFIKNFIVNSALSPYDVKDRISLTETWVLSIFPYLWFSHESISRQFDVLSAKHRDSCEASFKVISFMFTSLCVFVSQREKLVIAMIKTILIQNIPTDTTLWGIIHCNMNGYKIPASDASIGKYLEDPLALINL